MNTENIHQRQELVMKIILEMRKNNQSVNRFTVQSKLKQKGIKISSITTYRDITTINKQNTWLRDLSESNYSAMQEDISNQILWVETEAIRLYKKEWIIKKIIKRNTDKGDFIEEHITSELSGPKKGFLEIVLKAQDLKMKHTNGDNMHLSVSLLGNKLDDLQELVNKYEAESVDIIKLAEKI